jgi:gliding motility-associated-like protein
MRAALLIAWSFLCAAVQAAPPVALFTENKGQWPDQVLYRVRFPGGALFVEKSAFTFVLRTDVPHRHGAGEDHAGPVRGHAYRVHFVGGEARSAEGLHRQPHYENFFLGSDPARWGSGCGVFGGVVLKDVWPGIDLHVDGTHGLKYAFVLTPGADPAQVRLRYEGHDALQRLGERLRVHTSAGYITEEAPVSLQRSHGAADTIPTRYVLDGDRLSFAFDRMPDPSRGLVIDPVLTFGSYSGSTADNFGFTATYDASGHLYGGGNVFGIGYPTTPGAFDDSFNGGTCDVGISKWSPDGSSLLWSTYLGGVNNDLPHSMVVNSNDELYVMGSTGSSNFPITPGAYDASFNGGPSGFVGAYDFPNGADIFVTRLNANGTALLGSTFIGGGANDGLNGLGLTYNYGDNFRGEIALDALERPVVATVTASGNAPVTPNAPQPMHGSGTLDGYVFRMDPGLTTLLWATFVGGSFADAAYGVQFDSAGRVFITGGTQSTDMPMAGTPYAPAHAGHIDGFIARYSPDGSVLLSTTYVGTAQYDQCYFVQVDTNDDVYVVGQTRGNYPVTPGKYVNPGRTQFIHKFSNDLSTSLWSTRIGSGLGNEDISPSAFLVSDCGQIYFCGWGGSVNSPFSSTTHGLPTTPDAFQSTTDGSDFHIMVLNPDAASLSYATFFGGSQSAEHVDGGTSRFDKAGRVYQAVCAGCGGNDDFPTTPGAWSNTNNSFNCNMGVFKFDLAQVIAIIGIDGPSTVCNGQEVQFTNSSSGGDTYSWDFGDGGTSAESHPTHAYAEPGTYVVTLVMSDSHGCSPSDTATITVEVIGPPTAVVDPVPPICEGGSVILSASGGDSYQWSPPEGLVTPDQASTLATAGVATTYIVVVSTQCGSDTAEVTIEVSQAFGWASPDTLVCLGQPVPLHASGGTHYAWSPPGTLSATDIDSPIALPDSTTTYYVMITTDEGCELMDSVVVTVIDGSPEPALSDTAICLGASVQLVGPVADAHAWQAANGLTDLTVAAPVVSPTESTWYVVTASNACGSIVDSAWVEVVRVVADAWPDTLVCPGMPVVLGASGGTGYQWTPAVGLDDPTSATPTLTAWAPATYTVQVTDDMGCTGQASVSIALLPLPEVTAGDDAVVTFGTSFQLTATGNGTLSWSPPDGLSCTDCPAPWVRPDGSMVYTVTVTDANGCKNTDQLVIIVTGSLYVPNAFTPNGDGNNDTFGALGAEIETFRLIVFNRWGEEIFRTDRLDGRWNGTYKGVESPIDTYVWRIDVKERAGESRTLYGHVNLVR